MSSEHEKIDLLKWQGPVTVVGYPDLSAMSLTPGQAPEKKSKDGKKAKRAKKTPQTT